MENQPITDSNTRDNATVSSENGIELAESTQPGTPGEQTTFKKTKCKRWIIVTVTVISVLAVTLIVVLGVVLTRKETRPDLEFLPMPEVKSTLIRFVKGKPSTYKVYTEDIQTFLKSYTDAGQIGDNFMDCSKINGYRERRDWNRICRFDLSRDLTTRNPCIKQDDFGYDDGQPCVLIKLNKIYNWMPKPYDNGSIPDAVKNRYFDNAVNVRCAGESLPDQENMGTVNYFPPEGFPFKYFPFLNQENYRQPIMFAQFANVTNGLVIMVTCRAYAKNIPYDPDDLAGSVHFEIMVD